MISDRKIKVCFFSPGSYVYFNKSRKQVYGGAELQMFLLANELSIKNKYEILFFVGNCSQPKNEVYNNIKLIRSFNFPDSESFIMKSLKVLHYFILLLKNKPDIIITTTANTIVGITAFYSKILGIKHIHRTASRIDTDGSWIKKNGILGKVYLYGIKNASVIIVQNYFDQELLSINYGLKSIVLKNAIYYSEMHNEKKNGVLWVGRLNQLKQPELFLNLAIALPMVEFTMICPYNASDIKTWGLLKDKANTINNLLLIENIDFEQIQSFFNKAHLFVNTSLTEGFPNTFLQACAGRTPIISLNVDPDNFLVNNNCGVFCNNDLNLMIDSVKSLLSSPHKTEEMGYNAYNYLKKNHDVKAIAVQLEEMIESSL